MGTSQCATRNWSLHYDTTVDGGKPVLPAGGVHDHDHTGFPPEPCPEPETPPPKEGTTARMDVVARCSYTADASFRLAGRIHHDATVKAVSRTPGKISPNGLPAAACDQITPVPRKKKPA